MLSLCIPYYEAFPEKRQILERCVHSLPQVDELLILAGKQKNVATAINMLFSLSRGDYIIIANDDVIWDKGSIRDLCVPQTITSPLINGQNLGFSGHFFCVPREVVKSTGGYDEEYTVAYFDDDDFFRNAQSNGFGSMCIESVNIVHPEPGTTLHTYPNHSEFFELNKARFQQKWGV